MDEFVINPERRCRFCEHYCNYYYFDRGKIRQTSMVTCAVGYDIEEMDGRGCFKFEKRQEEIPKEIYPLGMLQNIKSNLQVIKENIIEIENFLKEQDEKTN